VFTIVTYTVNLSIVKYRKLLYSLEWLYCYNAPIFVKSSKQKNFTKSSTASELVGISDTLSQIVWTWEYLLCHGLPLGTAIVFQDNQSTIFLAEKGRSTSERSRHIKIRNFFVSHYIEENEIDLRYLPTGKIVADLLTKPLHGTMFTNGGNFTGLSRRI
jgi:hypothetical protein